MAAITLKTVPDEIHRKIKRMQLDLENKGVKKSLEEIYLDLIKEGLRHSNDRPDYGKLLS